MSIENAVRRAAVGATLKVALSGMKNDPERRIRYALDLLDCFPRNSLGDKLMARLRREMENPQSSVCKIVAAMAASVDYRILSTVGTNLCCNRMAAPEEAESCERRPRGIVFPENLEEAVRTGKKYGVYFYVISGLEPLRFREEIFGLCHGNRDCVFFLITDARFIDGDFADRCAEAGNIILSVRISSEVELSGSSGAFSILRKHRCLYGFTAGVNSDTIRQCCRKGFVDYMADVGCIFGWYFSDGQGKSRSGCAAAIRNVVRAAITGNSRPLLLLDAKIDRHIRDLFVAGGRCYIFCGNEKENRLSARYILADEAR